MRHNNDYRRRTIGRVICKYGANHLVPVCTPARLQHRGPIAEARDLKGYTLIHSPYEPGTAWLLEGGAGDVWPRSGPAFDDTIAIFDLIAIRDSGLQSHGVSLDR